MNASSTRPDADRPAPSCWPCEMGSTYSRQAVEQIIAETDLITAYECPDGQGWHLTISEKARR